MRHIDLPFVMGNENAAYEFPWSQTVMRQSLNGNDQCWVAVVGGEIVGHAVMKYVLDEAHLLNICIHPQNQGRGLGTSALKAVISRAESQGAREMFLEVRASNAAAIGLYEDAGFNETGRRNGYYPTDGGREDAILMAKVLSL